MVGRETGGESAGGQSEIRDAASGLSGGSSACQRSPIRCPVRTLMSQAGGHGTHLAKTWWTPKNDGALLLLKDSEKCPKVEQKFILVYT